MSEGSRNPNGPGALFRAARGPNSAPRRRCTRVGTAAGGAGSRTLNAANRRGPLRETVTIFTTPPCSNSRARR